VHRLLLLSPVGVPDPPTPEERAAQLSKFLTTYARTILFKLYIKFWEKGYTPGYVMRMLPESRGRQLVDGYVDRRLPAITDPEEQTILSEYMYTGSILPPSGEYCLGQLLGPGVMAHQPCLHRIPKLQVNHVSFLYGTMFGTIIGSGCDCPQTLSVSDPQTTGQTRVIFIWDQ